MTYVFNTVEKIQYVRDYIKAAWNAPQLDANDAALPALTGIATTDTLAGYKIIGADYPLTFLQVESTPFEEGPSKALSMSEYGFGLPLTLWRVVATTGLNDMGLYERFNMETLAATIANDRRLGGYVSYTTIKNIWSGDRSPVGQIVMAAGQSGDLCVAGLAFQVDIYCPE